jgi:hypothetical protein
VLVEARGISCYTGVGISGLTDHEHDLDYSSQEET